MTIGEYLEKEYGMDTVHACGEISVNLAGYNEEVMSIPHDSYCGKKIKVLAQVMWRMWCIIDSSLHEKLLELTQDACSIIYYG
jgi:hypothetical protein